MLRILYTLCLFFAIGSVLPAQTNKKIQSLQRQHAEEEHSLSGADAQIY